MDLRIAVKLFTTSFGTEPNLLTRGPGRVNLIGEHTDYNDGFVLPIAIDRSVVAAVRLRPDRRIRLVTDFTPRVIESGLDSLESAAGHGWAAYPLGVVWALGEAGADLAVLPGFDLALTSDVPVGAGLSSSAAIESAVSLALNELWGTDLDRPGLARVGQRAENVVAGAPTGIMDQSASLLGRRDTALFLDCRSLTTETVPLDLGQAGLRILVIDTKVSHAHAEGGYASRRASCEKGAAVLGVSALRDLRPVDLAFAQAVLDFTTFRRVRHVVTENERVLETVAALRDQGPRGIGGFLLASHASMRDDFEISTPELDAAVAATISAGAIGARMTGGGFGGSAIAFVPVELVPAAEQAVRTAFANAGFAAPDVFQVRASAGAAIIDQEIPA